MPSQREILIGALMSSALLLPGVAAAAVLNPFNIVINFDNPNTAAAGDHNMTAGQQAFFTSAEAFWEQRITGNRYDLGIPDLVIDAYAIAIDGAGGTLASAGPTGLGVIAGDGIGGVQDFFYATRGLMRFDTADIGALASAGTFFDTIVHEMAHVIGFGTLWNTAQFGGPFAPTQNVYTDGTGQYTGAYALATYNAEFGLSETFVPVETNRGGSGTIDGHWDEETFAGGRVDADNTTDLMGGFLNPLSPSPDSPLIGTTLSATTIASFADIGYTTIVTDPMTPIPAPPAMAMSLGGLALLGALRGRRRRKPAA